jgi:16S rRNA (uracil1498-N3)-methyltransferase
MAGEARPPRFFVSADEDASVVALGPGRDVRLPAAEAHHAAHVLRLAPGDAVELFDGRGACALAHLTKVHRSEVRAAVDELRAPRPRPAPLIHLAFAVPKGRRLDWLLEKATELGVASLRPVIFERSVAGGAGPSPGRLRRWMGRCIAAAKQSGLDFLPAVEAPLALAGHLAAAATGIRLYGDPAADALPIRQAVHGQAGGARTYYIVVGPEGGLTDGERAALRQANCTPVRLGNAVLRVETAALALVSAVLALEE